MNFTKNISSDGQGPAAAPDAAVDKNPAGENFPWRTALRSILLFLAAVLPVAFYLRTYDSVTVKTTIMQLGVLAAAAVWLIGSLNDGRIEISSKTAPLILPAALLLIWNGLSFLHSPYRLASTDGFIKQEAFLLSFILTLISFPRRDVRKAVLVMLAAWAAIVVYGFLQSTGVDPFVWKGAFGDRLFATLANPNLFSAYLLLLFPLGLALMCDGGVPAGLRSAAGAFSLIGVFLAIKTGSSSGKTASIIAAVIFIISAWRSIKEGQRGRTLVFAGMCAIIFLISFPFMAQQSRPDRDHDFRLQTREGAVSLIKNQPWMGSGPGSFWVRYPAFRKQQIFFIEQKHNNETDHPENELLEQCADTGLVGAFLWLWLFCIVIFRGGSALLNGDREDDSIYTAGLLAATLASVLLALNGISTRFVAPGWLIYFSAGLLGAASSGKQGEPDSVLTFPLSFGGVERILFIPILAGAVYLGYGSIKIFRSDLCHNIGIFYAKAGNWDEAAKNFGQESQAAPTYIMSRYFLGNAFQDRGGPGDYERALKEYRNVRSMAPDYVQVHFQEARALEKLNRIPEAIERMERQVRLDPVWDTAWLELAGLYGKAGNIEKAQQAAKQAEAVKAMWTVRH
ncbi:MAG: O-antigen ligase family protein [Elusimicrobia bacterium]|nr:O-antigen ligase family protein [Elusimicrobiota bacterium]